MAKMPAPVVPPVFVPVKARGGPSLPQAWKPGAAPPPANGARPLQARQAPGMLTGAGRKALVQRAALPSHLVSSADLPGPSKALTPEGLAEREKEKPRDLSAASQYWHELVVSGGLLYFKKQLVDKGGLTMAQAQLVRSKVIFVLTLDDRLLARPEPAGIQTRADGFTHANFTSGQDIKAAGQLFVHEGRVIRIDNESGHYKPHGNTLRHVIKKLKREGADLRRALMLSNNGDSEQVLDVYDYILGQKTVVPNEEWQSQDIKFAAYTEGKVWNRKPVKYW